MMGITPEDFTSLVPAHQNPPAAIGANCGVGASDLLVSVQKMHIANPDLVIVAKANCGIPVVHGDHVHYSGSPSLMADYTGLAIDAGIKIIGGCCGTTFEHVAAMRAAIDNHQPGPVPSEAEIIEKLGALASPPPSAEKSEKRRGTGRRKRA
jgi:5-methyltetrahydrofolate--homocysteine methyltransferase